MAMLAEPRCKEKWSDDPRNSLWANDKSKFGYQMMIKMGWSDGKGLGLNESGGVSHINVRKKKSKLIGFGSKETNEDNWIAHQDEFNALLDSLNQGKAESKVEKTVTSLEDRVKKSKKKILYHRFVRSKDLANASSEDLACIFGQRKKSSVAIPHSKPGDIFDSDAAASSYPVEYETSHDVRTVTSTCNLQDYFAAKMAALKKAATTSPVLVSVEKSSQHLIESTNSDLSKKSPSRDLAVSKCQDEVQVLNFSERTKKLKKKKLGKNAEEAKSQFVENGLSEDISVAPEMPFERESNKKRKKKDSKANEELALTSLASVTDNLDVQGWGSACDGMKKNKARRLRRALSDEEIKDFVC